MSGTAESLSGAQVAPLQMEGIIRNAAEVAGVLPG